MGDPDFLPDRSCIDGVPLFGGHFGFGAPRVYGFSTSLARCYTEVDARRSNSMFALAAYVGGTA